MHSSQTSQRRGDVPSQGPVPTRRKWWYFHYFLSPLDVLKFSIICIMRTIKSYFGLRFSHAPTRAPLAASRGYFFALQDLSNAAQLVAFRSVSRPRHARQISSTPTLCCTRAYNFVFIVGGLIRKLRRATTLLGHKRQRLTLHVTVLLETMYANLER